MVHALKGSELFAERCPTTAAGGPVVLIQVGADPNVRAPRFVGVEKRQAFLEHSRDIRTGGRRLGVRQGQQRLR